jgi:hypothetical protein
MRANGCHVLFIRLRARGIERIEPRPCRTTITLGWLSPGQAMSDAASVGLRCLVGCYRNGS